MTEPSPARDHAAAFAWGLAEATFFFNLSDYEGFEVARDDGGERTVVIAAPVAACRGCGVISPPVSIS